MATDGMTHEPQGDDRTEDRSDSSGWHAPFSDDQVMEASQIYRAGRAIGSDRARELESLLVAQPKNTAYRASLLGYYETIADGEEARDSCDRHIIWIIEHAPTSPVARMLAEEPMFLFVKWPELREKAKNMLLKALKIHPDDIYALATAAAFFSRFYRGLAVEIYDRLKSIEPNNWWWSERLAYVYEANRKSSKGSSDVNWASLRLSELQNIARLMTSEGDRPFLLSRLADAALEAGEPGSARDYAEEALKSAGSDGDVIHRCHTVLGRLAMRDGSIDQAINHLESSINITHAPVASSFGPQMILSQELLGQGRTQDVIDYLNDCMTVWKSGRDRLNMWIQEIKSGRTPRF